MAGVGTPTLDPCRGHVWHGLAGVVFGCCTRPLPRYPLFFQKRGGTNGKGTGYPATRPWHPYPCQDRSGSEDAMAMFREEPRVGETWMVTKACPEHKHLGTDYAFKPFTWPLNACPCRQCVYAKVERMEIVAEGLTLQTRVNPEGGP